MTATDTIFALSSGAGRSAVAVVRATGPAVKPVLEAVAGELPPARNLVLRSLRDPASGEILDKAMIAWLPGPRSFTGEDCAEFHLHGSQAVVAAVLAALSALPHVRPAEPGEFTRRAFLNGKMDLVEAEGLADLLEARTAGQRRQAFRQMSGAASAVFEGWRQHLLLIRADIEAVVDFADEPGVAEEAGPRIESRIRSLLAEMTRVVEQASTAEIVRDGVRVVIAGHPNTGKSSLLNALARREAAIVSDIPGTTRDAIEVSLDVAGVPAILTDTAGLRLEAADRVEEEGIRRTRGHIAAADLLIWVWSADVAGSENHGLGPSPDIVVRNKCDLDSGLLRNELKDGEVQLSARHGDGVTGLLDRLSELLRERVGDAGSALLVSSRQSSAVRNSIRFLNDALSPGFDELEIKAEAIRCASEEIGRLTGRIGVEEWLGAIFSRFCIGK